MINILVIDIGKKVYIVYHQLFHNVYLLMMTLQALVNLNKNPLTLLVM